jgi:hypothetical protein
LDRYEPLFLGQPIFGEVGYVTTATFDATAAEVEAYLGLSPGSTPPVYGLCYQVTGTLTGPTEAAVVAAQALLQGYASAGRLLCGPFSHDDGLAWPGGFEVIGGCYFLAAELVFSAGGITGANSWWELPYRLVIRHVAGD